MRYINLRLTYLLTYTHDINKCSKDSSQRVRLLTDDDPNKNMLHASSKSTTVKIHET